MEIIYKGMYIQIHHPLPITYYHDIRYNIRSGIYIYPILDILLHFQSRYRYCLGRPLYGTSLEVVGMDIIIYKYVLLGFLWFYIRISQSVFRL